MNHVNDTLILWYFAFLAFVGVVAIVAISLQKD